MHDFARGEVDELQSAVRVFPIPARGEVIEITPLDRLGLSPDRNRPDKIVILFSEIKEFIVKTGSSYRHLIE